MFMGAKDTRKAISKEELIKLANEMIKKDWEYMDGMLVEDAHQRDESIVLKGEFFLDADGIPTPKSNAVFNMFRKVSAVLSKEYKIAD